MWNLQEQGKKTFCYQKLFWPFTVWQNCSSDLKMFANSWPSASNLKRFSSIISTILETKYHFWEKGQKITRNRRWCILECQKENRIFRVVPSSFWLDRLSDPSSDWFGSQSLPFPVVKNRYYRLLYCKKTIHA